MDLNGIESHAWNCYTKLRCSWLPIGNTIYVEDTAEINQMEDIYSDVNDIKFYLGKFDLIMAEKYKDDPLKKEFAEAGKKFFPIGVKKRSDNKPTERNSKVNLVLDGFLKKAYNSIIFYFIF